MFTQRTISSSSETNSDKETDEWSLNDNPLVLEEILGHPGITNMTNVPESTVDAAVIYK